MHYVLATVEGLHLTCDFVIYSAALYGCPPDYVPTPVGVHEAYNEIHKLLGGMPRQTLEIICSQPVPIPYFHPVRPAFWHFPNEPV